MPHPLGQTLGQGDAAGPDADQPQGDVGRRRPRSSSAIDGDQALHRRGVANGRSPVFRTARTLPMPPVTA